MQGFLLGLANGANCIAYCVPSLVPYLLGEGKNIRQNSFILGQFLSGRLLGYLLFGILAWMVSRYIDALSDSRGLFLGLVYIILAALLLLYSLSSPAGHCAGRAGKSPLAFRAMQKYSSLLPVITGFLTGLNLCPPFLLAFADAVQVQNVGQSLWLFFTFFLGTSLYFLPFTLLGAFNNFLPLKTIGKMVAVLMSLYYLYTGTILLIGGIKII